ncbi:MAG: phosphatase PAP2 family protein [Bacteroidota bacterium]
MIDLLLSLDVAVFYFINHTLQNVVGDAVMPFITDLNKKPPVLVIVVVLWLGLLVKGGKEGRIAALLLVPAIAFSDQLNSSYLKFIVERIRPCHTLPDVHLLVPCGSGLSFPSSHAVNNFTGAVVLSTFLPKARWWFFGFAGVVALSRVYVGAHYPLDVLVGAGVGMLCGWSIVKIYQGGEKWWLSRRPPEKPDEKQ